MIVSDRTFIKIAPSNINYWKDRGYSVELSNTQLGNKCKTIEVYIKDLAPKSNAIVKCVCDICSSEFENRYSRNTDTCYPCYKSIKMTGNTLGSVNKGKPNFKNRGPNSPRWNPNKSALAKYRAEVYRYTRLQPIDLLKNSDKPRGKCGVDGAYQLDHIISIKEGFERGIDAESIGDFCNLQFIPWEENLNKRHKGNNKCHYQ